MAGEVSSVRHQTVKAGGWQPIATAPKDGTWILVNDLSENWPPVNVACWAEPVWGGKKTWVAITTGPSPDNHECEATHWFPLPALPRRETADH